MTKKTSKFDISAPLADIAETVNFCFVIFIIESDGFVFFDWFRKSKTCSDLQEYIKLFLEDIDIEGQTPAKHKYDDLINGFHLEVGDFPESSQRTIMKGNEELSKYYNSPYNIVIHIVKNS